MSSPHYPLKTILSVISRYKDQSDPSKRVTKRTILNQAPLGGISPTQLKLFFLSLPFLEFAAIFNPLVFETLGLARSIIFYIVFMSLLMMVIFGVTWKNNKKAIEKITPSWMSLFPNVDLEMLLSSGHTPYKEFFKTYALIANDDLDNEALKVTLEQNFAQMKEANKELFEAMERAKQR